MAASRRDRGHRARSEGYGLRRGNDTKRGNLALLPDLAGTPGRRSRSRARCGHGTGFYPACRGGGTELPENAFGHVDVQAPGRLLERCHSQRHGNGARPRTRGRPGFLHDRRGSPGQGGVPARRLRFGSRGTRRDRGREAGDRQWAGKRRAATGSALMRFSASAPGKAVLSGEYAVLQGAPAIAMAVDCRARVTAESTAEDCHTVVSPGLTAEARFRCNERGSIDWLDEHRNGNRPNPDQVLFEYVWRNVQAMPSENLSFTLDTRRFFDPESSLKLGFGSSSALAAALTAVLVRSGPS